MYQNINLTLTPMGQLLYSEVVSEAKGCSRVCASAGAELHFPLEMGAISHELAGKVVVAPFSGTGAPGPTRPAG